MKAISINQPYAGLTILGHKNLEVRPRPTTYRGLILICASKTNRKIGDCEAVFIPKVLNESVPMADRVGIFATVIVKGFALGVREIVDCRPMTPADSEEACFPYKEGLYVYVYSDMIYELKWSSRFAVKGQLGIFNVEPPTLSENKIDSTIEAIKLAVERKTGEKVVSIHCHQTKI